MISMMPSLWRARIAAVMNQPYVLVDDRAIGDTAGCAPNRPDSRSGSATKRVGFVADLTVIRIYV